MGLFDLLHSLSKHLPEVKTPDKPLMAKERLIWTGIALLLFFIMYNVTCFGVLEHGGGLDFLQTITASRLGSLLTTGIGPLVLASIFLQLFNGAGLLNLDMHNPKDRAKFHETQKVIAILLALLEAGIFVFGGRILLSVDGVNPIPASNAVPLAIFVVLQIAMGSVILLYLDEIVSKYGIGSGISLFIAAGVSFAVIAGAIGLFVAPGGVLERLTSGGAEAIPSAIMAILPLVFTGIVFVVVVYAEGMKVEIPLAFNMVRGMVPKLPLKFFYVSNIPVIFAAALIMNIHLFGGLLAGKSLVIGGVDVVKIIGATDSRGMLIDGILYLFTPIYMAHSTEAHIQFFMTSTPIFHIPQWIHAIVYVAFLSLISVLFGLFWIETANMDAKSMADQLASSGLQIPGFRRDKRLLERILEKHIVPLTIAGSFSVGLLAGLADLTGALGTGTGILLTVGIFYRMYEQMEQMQIFELYPQFTKMLGIEK